MKNKILLSAVIFSSVFLAMGCESVKVNGSEDITYTNKFECSRKETSTTQQVYYSTKEELLSEDDKGKNAVENELSKVYDFNKEGDKLLAYYDVVTYNYLVDYDMNEQKKYFEKTCDDIDKDIYKSCKVDLKDKTIIITKEADLNSKENKEQLSKTTLSSIKENFAESLYTCK